jgi:PAS domain S-box-containing protein
MNSTVRSKIISGLALVLLLMATHQVTSIYISRTLEQRWASTLERDIQSTDLVMEVVRQAEGFHTGALLHLTTYSEDGMRRYEEQMRRAAVELGTLLDALQDTYRTEAELQKLAEFRFAWHTHARIWEEQVLPASRTEGKEAARALVQEDGIAGMAAAAAFGRLEELQKTTITAFHQRLALVNQQRLTSQNVLLILLLLAIVPSLALGVHMASRISEAVNLVLNAARLVAEGDLDWSVSVETGDEIESMAESLTAMTRYAKKALAARREAAEQLQRQVSEREHIAGMLASEKDRLDTTLRMVGDGVIATDTEGNVVLINQAAAELTGWTQDQVIGRPLDEVFHLIDGTTGTRRQNTVDEALQRGRTVRLADQTNLVAKDGTQRPIDHASAPFRDQHSEIIGAVIVFREQAEVP